MSQPCSNPECHTAIADDHPTGFCSSCEDMIDRLRYRGWPKFDQWLRLESEFVQWCEANGHPHPHLTD